MGDGNELHSLHWHTLISPILLMTSRTLNSGRCSYRVCNVGFKTMPSPSAVSDEAKLEFSDLVKLACMLTNNDVMHTPVQDTRPTWET